RWAITADELRQVKQYNIFEIFNGHPQINNFGGGGVPGLEEVWDRILSSGRLVYGIAVDDAHHFKRHGMQPPPSPVGVGSSSAPPGWIRPRSYLRWIAANFIRQPALSCLATTRALKRSRSPFVKTRRANTVFSSSAKMGVYCLK